MSKLTQNTTDLQAILDAVNALPEAGPSFTVSFDDDGNVTFSGVNMTNDSNGNVVLS